MKNIIKLICFIYIFTVLKVNGQNYNISFSGSGTANTVSSVKVVNLTKGISLTLNGSDILHLQAIVTGIKSIDNGQLSELKIYPNPMTDYSTIEFSPPTAGDAVITVSEMTGKKVAQIQIHLENLRQTYRLSGINNGFYLINVKGKNYQFSGKLLSNGKSNSKISIDKLNVFAQNENKKSKKAGKTPNKGVQTTVDMAYTDGDRLKFTGISGNYYTVITDILTQDKTITFNFISCTDGDNNSYPVVEIGTQVWMAENLKTSKYSNGDPIPNVTDNASWINLSQDTDPTWTLTGAFCWYNNTSTPYENDYGKLYNFGAVETGKLCPSGWHVPTIAEWHTLGDPHKIISYDPYGFELMESGTSHWIEDSGTNETGFTALAGGLRGDDGTFSQIGMQSYYWSSNGNGTVYRGLAEFYPIPVYYSFGKTPTMSTFSVREGLSIRCVKNQ